MGEKDAKKESTTCTGSVYCKEMYSYVQYTIYYTMEEPYHV